MVSVSHTYIGIRYHSRITALNNINWWHSSGISQSVGATFGVSFPPLDHVGDHRGGGGVIVEGGAQGAHRLGKNFL